MAAGNPPISLASRRGRKKAAPLELTLRVTLEGVEPPVWRMVRVPEEYTLQQLHRVIQMAFGWLDYHLYAFQVADRRFEAPWAEAEGEDASVMSLRRLSLGVSATFLYNYDFGDDWRLWIELTDAEPTMRDHDEPGRALLLAGARAAPPEDSGGPLGYQEKLDALAKPRARHAKELVEWIGKSYDPELFDLRTTRNNISLAAVWGAL
jgi:pRiA4b ORF-3-like protein